MVLVDGDVAQYEMIKRGSVGDYLIKLDNYVTGLERQIETQKQGNAKRK